MTGPLPEFDKPPLIEVALSVQFEKVSGLGVPQLGLIWQHFRNRFPVTEEHPPLEPAFEQFGRVLSFGRRVQFQLTQTIPIPRLWFLNEAGTDLVQVQPDRFTRNWKTGETEQPYPRYTVLRKNFQEDWECFCNLLSDEGMDTPRPNQCEVTYVNMLPAGEGWEDYGDLDQVVGIFSQKYSDEFLGKPESAAVKASYRILRDNGSNAGRLHVSADPVTRQADKKPCWRLQLTARGEPLGAGTDGILEFFDRGHEYVVQGFASLTSKPMHEIWGRRQ